MEQVAVTRLGKGLLRMSISIIVIMSEGYTKSHFTYKLSIGLHRLVKLIIVLDALVRSPTNSNVVMRKTRIRRETK